MGHYRAATSKDENIMKLLTRILTFLVLLGLIAGCASSTAGDDSNGSQDQGDSSMNGQGSPSQDDMAVSNLSYDSNPNIPPETVSELVVGNTDFTFDLYRALAADPGNLFLSPYSISMALAMTYAGAAGDTQAQMAETLHFSLPQDQLHSTFNQLTLTLLSRSELPEGEGFKFNIANALWAQQGYAFLDDYLDVLARSYDAGIHLVDFIAATEEARQRINTWVADQTEDKIKDIIPEGALTAATRLVLTNAIYFNAAWASTFEEEATQTETFTDLEGTQHETPMMRQISYFLYTDADGVTVVEMPYVGGQMSMVMLMPPLDQFQAFEGSLDAERLQSVLDDMVSTNIHLSMPLFEFESEFGLSQTLAALGMPNAFSTEADFSGMDGGQDLFLQSVLHKAFISVDEEGTEAAAATAVVVGATALEEEPIQVSFDHPFIFLIRDRETGAILFIGRLLQP
jgi:serpin B